MTLKPSSPSHLIHHYFMHINWIKIFSIIFGKKAFLWYFCLIGSSVQFISLGRAYFAYEHISVITMEIPQLTFLPDPVVCFEIYYLINYTKLYDKYPEIANIIRDKYQVYQNPEPAEIFRENLFQKVAPTDLINDIARKIRVREMSQLLYSQEDLVINTVIRGQRTDDEDEDDNQSKATCFIEHYYKEYSICYNFVCSKKRQVFFTIADKDKSPQSLELFRIRFNQSLLNLIPTFYVTLVEPNTKPRGQVLKWVTFNTDKRSMKFIVHFYVFHSVLLPEPFKSRCKNYSLEGYSSRIDMRDDCLESNAMKDLGVSFHTAITDPELDKPFAFVSYLDNRNNGAYVKQFKEIISVCDKLTLRPDCDIKYYLTQRRTPEHLFKNESELVIDHIREPNIKVELQPKMKLIDCLIFVGSVLSTWFGFSTFVHLPLILSFMADLISKIRCGNSGSFLASTSTSSRKKLRINKNVIHSSRNVAYTNSAKNKYRKNYGNYWYANDAANLGKKSDNYLSSFRKF